ncbi:secreted aspartic proteinase precursor [Nemania abortiva]|nr:secreted aspartic proteinase precursor [Nemania abortiva]
MVPRPSTLALTAALAGFTAASPVQPRPGYFTAHQVANPNFVAHGPRQLAKSYLKHGIPLPEGLAHTIAELDAARRAKRNSGSVETVPEEADSQYLTTVYIGTPLQPLNLDFDSGSDRLWVFSTLLPPELQCGNQPLYDPWKSITGTELLGGNWSITYADLSGADGALYYDIVTVGGISFPKQAVGAATNITYIPCDSNKRGFMGLSISKINPDKPEKNTWFDNVAKSLDAPVWTADLKYQAPGSFDFGRVDTSKYTGNITFVPVDARDGLWKFNMSGWAVGDKPFVSANITTVADTGTTLAIMPDIAVKAYYDIVPTAFFSPLINTYIFSCNITPPDFHIGVGDGRVTIPGQYVNYAPLSIPGNYCMGSIVSDRGTDNSIFGDIALKSAFVVFDATPGNEKLGFASKKV